MFMYLKSAVAELSWPDWLFTDQYLFHEVLHNFVMEGVDYSVGTPVLNTLYAELVDDAEFTQAWLSYTGLSGTEPVEVLAAEQLEMIGLVLTHVHVYAIMTAVLRAVGEAERLATIREYETSLPSSHPSYVKAWNIVIAIEDDPAAMDALLAEVR